MQGIRMFTIGQYWYLQLQLIVRYRIQNITIDILNGVIRENLGPVVPMTN